MRSTFDTRSRVADVRLRPENAPATLGRPPATVQRGGGHHADDRLEAVLARLHQRDQGRPYGDTAYVVLGAVDRVDDPAPRAGALDPVLLAQDRVTRARPVQVPADQFLRVLVRLAHRGHVRLGLDLEVQGLEPVHRRRVGGVRQYVGKAQIIVVVGHAVTVSTATRPGYTAPRRAGTSPHAGAGPYADP